jgi:hydrogenase-4 component B
LSENLFIIYAIFIFFSIGATLGLFTRGQKYNTYFTYIPSAFASFLTIVLSLTVFSSENIHLTFFNIQHLFDFEIFIDGVAAFFLLIIGLISFAISIYSLSYSKKFDDKKNNSSLGMLFNVFIVSMILVVISNNIFFFLIFWELMSLTSFFLVIYEHENKNNLKSGLTYLVMTHLGTGFIFASFILMYTQTGNFSFDSFRDISIIPQYVKDIAFVLAFVGFGTKAGMVPLHTWLPKAHPSAPSNVSALMSAVMLKIAIYGMVRYLFDFNAVDSSPDYVWLGMGIIVVGSISALVGILYALVENDIKRALAFSSIENVGIIFIGLGLSVVFAASHLQSLSVLAFIASMFHTLNHSIFKGLLFMTAGSIHYSTHTKNIEDLGGLIKKMPWTAVMFLVGSIAIIGLPPLNGFISEWLTLQSLLAVFQIPSNILQVSLAFAILVFALTIGLSGATFVRLFGITFLSKSRSTKAANAVEVPKFMLIGKAILASSCILLGILPFLGMNLIVSAFNLPYMPSSPFETISIANTVDSNFASLMMPGVLVILTSVFVGVFVFVRIIGCKTKTVKYGTWDCGFGNLSEKTQYTATSLAEPLRRIFGVFYKPHNDIDADFYTKENLYLRKSIHVISTTRDIFDEKLYGKTISGSLFVLNKIRKIQSGKVNVYILYIMITLIALLLFVGFGAHE